MIENMTAFGPQDTTPKYKDILFKDIFSDPVRFLELYNAVSNSQYTTDAKVIILENHPLLAESHDVAGSIDGNLVVLCEHQSTYNPNMPLRMYLYFADILKLSVIDENIYGYAPVNIPVPVFYVLYNGTSNRSKDSLTLSELYPSKVKYFSAEIDVKFIDINSGYNIEVLSKSPWLDGYSKLVSKIKEYLSLQNSQDKSTELAINWCVSNNIMKEYLQINYGRVIKMLNYEITDEQWYKIRERDAKLLGRAEGIAEGRIEGRAEGKILGRVEIFLEQGFSVTEIATRLKLSESAVIKIIETLKTLS